VKLSIESARELPFARSAHERARSQVEGIDLPDDLLSELERIAATGAPTAARDAR
jgi:hypothetical protein